MQPIDPDFLAGGKRIGQDQLLVLGFKPRAGHQAGRRSRADLFSEFGHAAVFSSAVKMPFSMHNSRRAISKTSNR